MGNFFTSTQIYNPEQLDKESLKNCFCEKMKKEGYELCDSDSAELSYILAFSDCNKWVAITSEAYEEGNKFAHDDAGRISKMMKTTCINTTVIDSDCAVMEMYSKSGQKANTLIIGRADDYFGTKIKQPSEQVWKPFLNEGFTWEQFIEICNSNETFVEDSLSKLAETIGMDSNIILFSVEDANEENENTVFLNFRKVSASKKKKYTLNSAFKEIFGELLEPMGFKLVKSKYPYYLRVVGEGIIQAVSFAKEKSLNPESNNDEEGITIYIGIDLLINPMINFDKNPTIVDNQRWMVSMSDLYGSFIAHMEGFKDEHEHYSFFYQKGNCEEMIDALKKNRDELMTFVLEFFEKSKTLEDIYQLGEITSSIRNDVVVLLGKTDELIEEYKEKLSKEMTRLESVHLNKNPALLKIFKERTIKFTEEAVKRADLLRKGTKEYNEFIENAEKTKEQNLEILKALGVI